MLNRENVLKPVVLLTISAVIISFSSILVKVSHVPSTVSAFYRVCFGSFFLICACIAGKEFKKRSLKNNFLAVLCGLFFAFDLWAWHSSIQYVGPGLATILANCQVFVLSVVGFLVFKEKISLKFVLSLPMAFVGLFMIIGLDFEKLSPQYRTGILLGLATAAFYSMFLLLLRKIQSDKNDFSLFYYLMLLSVSCSVFLGGEIYLTGASFAIPDFSSLLALLCLGLFIQTLAWVVISNSLPKVRASHAGLILLMQPALSFVWDVIFFDRQTGIFAWAGVVMVLLAIYLGMIGKAKTS